MNEYTTYRKSNSQEDLAELKDILDNAQIKYIIEESASSVDLTFTGGNPFDKEYSVKILPSDFQAVDKLLEGLANEAIKEIDKDHYLLEFSDDELLEVIEKQDEWSKQDFIIAKKILEKRGVKITQEKIEDMKKERISKLSEPEKGQGGWIVLGYISAFLGGALGIFIGWHLFSHKKILPDGQKVYGYYPKTRSHGKNIFIIGVIFIFFWLLFYLLLRSL